MAEEVRPIDANSLIKDIEQIRNMVSAARAGLVRVDVIGLVLKTVMEAPTVDAEPVRHGWWIDSAPINIWRCYECSECKYEVSGGAPSFCPNCGAKMNYKNDHERVHSIDREPDIKLKMWDEVDEWTMPKEGKEYD